MASVIARRWNRERILRTRIAELATMYRLTAEFTGKRDLQSVLDLVARTVVDLLGARHRHPPAQRGRHGTDHQGGGQPLAGVPQQGPDPPVGKQDQPAGREGRQDGLHRRRRDGPRVLYPGEAAREGIVGPCAPADVQGAVRGGHSRLHGRAARVRLVRASLLQAIAAQAAAAIVKPGSTRRPSPGPTSGGTCKMAAEVQRRMIPATPPQLPGIDIAAVYEPCFELGGDFYDFHEFAADNLRPGRLRRGGQGRAGLAADGLDPRRPSRPRGRHLRDVRGPQAGQPGPVRTTRP